MMAIEVSQRALDLLAYCYTWRYATNISQHFNLKASEVDETLSELMDAQMLNRSTRQPYAYRRAA